MTGLRVKRVVCGAGATVAALAIAVVLHAQLGIGTWVKQGTPTDGVLAMTVEACCNGGERLTYQTANKITMMLETQLDGKDAPLLLAGQPTGVTMGITRVDDHHAVSVLKANGVAYGTSKVTLSPDGKTITIETEITNAVNGRTPGKTTETWLKK